MINHDDHDKIQGWQTRFANHDEIREWQTKFAVFSILVLMFSVVQLVLAARSLDQADQQETRIEKIEKQSDRCGCGRGDQP